MKKIVKLSILLIALLFSVSACTTEKKDTVIRIGASITPHAEILEVIRPLVEAKGFTLEVIEFTDYVLPNTNLNEGELDANYFQHVPYLTDFNIENGTKIVSVLAVHFEPLGLYPGKTLSLEALADNAKIAVPNDATNEARALNLLQDLGLITIDPSKKESATILDITSNPKNLEIIELEAAQLARALPDVDLAVINGNYALEAGITNTVLTTEDKASDAALKYANILAVREGSETSEKTLILIEALSSSEVKQYIKDTYYPVVISVTE
jgi:D-methionine transport system substrate-binding protein